MLKDAWKWMVATLAAAAVLVAGLALLFRALPERGAARETPAPPAALTAQAAANTAAADTPAPDGTVAPSQTPPPEAETPSPTPTAAPLEASARAAEWLSVMTLEEKLGQLVMFGFSGTEAPGEAFAALYERYPVGNYILYGSNIASGDSDGGFARAARLTESIRALTHTEIPPLVSIDVEGGSVVRFRWSPWPSSARTLGRRDDSDAARAQFCTIGLRLRETGINMDLAPVLDVSENAMQTPLKTRIISGDEQVAARIGSACVMGLRDAACLSVAKHFPGHGGTSVDSHDTTPVDTRAAETILSYDIPPFAAAVEAGVDAVLVAHISYPALDETDIASMSAPIITELLRGELGFTGLVVSDDFRMAGLSARYDLADAAVRFLLAGGDLILCGAQSDKQETILAALYQAAADGVLTNARIDESVYRILLKKAQLGL